MECWNSGVVRIKSGKRGFIFFPSYQPIIPLFQHSSWSEASFRMVEKISLSAEERVCGHLRKIS